MGCTNCRHKVPQENEPSIKLSVETDYQYTQQSTISPKKQLRRIKIYIDQNDKQKLALEEFKSRYDTNKRDSYFSTKQQKLLQKSNKIETNNKQLFAFEKSDIQNEEFFKFGGTSSIYKAYCVKLQKHIIIKRIFLNNFSEEQIIQFENEQQFLEQNFHPNIIQYYGSQRNQNILEIQMEYGSGGSLKDLLNKEKYFPEQEVKLYTKEILKALQILHSQNLIYRDLKLENIVLDSKGNIKLIDFGAICNTQSQLDIDIGTINYQAPELFNQQKQNIERYIDIWALGCLVFEMLTGKSLFPNQQNIKTIQEILNYQNLSKNYDVLSCSILTKDFIQRCLEIDPNQRNNCYELYFHPFLNLKNSRLTLNDLEQIKIVSNQAFSCESLDEKQIYSKQNTLIKNSSHKKEYFSKVEKDILISKFRQSFLDFDQELQEKQRKKLNKETETIESVDLIIQKNELTQFLFQQQRLFVLCKSK